MRKVRPVLLLLNIHTQTVQQPKPVSVIRPTTVFRFVSSNGRVPNLGIHFFTQSTMTEKEMQRSSREFLIYSVNLSVICVK